MGKLWLKLKVRSLMIGIPVAHELRIRSLISSDMRWYRAPVFNLGLSCVIMTHALLLATSFGLDCDISFITLRIHAHRWKLIQL